MRLHAHTSPPAGRIRPLPLALLALLAAVVLWAALRLWLAFVTLG
jgi:hypothetical protein